VIKRRPRRSGAWLHNIEPQCTVMERPLVARSGHSLNGKGLALDHLELRARARAAAEALTKRPAGSLNHTKALMRDMDKIASQISREGALFRERLQTGEAREAFAAFAERRKPDFSKVAG
jgi:1,4-dihydroxy-2-naphthoyl-CoA synthase